MRMNHNIFKLICSYLDNYDIFILQFCTAQFYRWVKKYNKINIYNLCNDIYFKLLYNLYNRSLIDQILAITIVKNYLNICKWLFKFGFKINIANHIHIKLCAEYGRLNFCKFFADKSYLNKDQLMSIAAYKGYFNICDWLLNKSRRINLCYDDGELLYNISYRGDNELLKKVFKYQRKIVAYKIKALMGAIAGGNLIICKWLINNMNVNIAEKKYTALITCVSNGQYEILSWLMKFKMPIAENIDVLFKAAASSGNLKICKFLITYNPRRINDAFKTAVSCGHINICEWIAESYDVINNSTIIIAVEYNQFELCKWLIIRAANIKVDYNYLFNAAVIYDDVEMCKWVINYFECDVIINKSLINAVISGSLNVCKWLYEIGNKKINKDLLYEAVNNGHLNICKWLKDKNDLNVDLFKIAAENGFIDICYWITQQLSVPLNIIKKYAPQLMNL